MRTTALCVCASLASGYLLLGAGQSISRKPLGDQDEKDVLKVIEAAGAVGRKGSAIAKMPVWSDTYKGYMDRGLGNVDPQIRKALDPLALPLPPGIGPGIGERIFNPDSGKLGNLLTVSEPPSQLDSEWVKVTKNTAPFYGQASYESVLASRIVESPGNLRPADVLRMALETCGNDYPLATLTAHNLLKEMAYTSRNFQGMGTVGIVQDGSDAPPPLSFASSEVIDKLQNLREAGHLYDDDKIGPWYHVFGLLFLGSALTCTDAAVGSKAENALRELHVFPHDPQKQYANTWASELACQVNDKLNAMNVSVLLYGEHGVVAGEGQGDQKGVFVYSRISPPADTLPFTLFWHDETGRTLALGLPYITYYPKAAGLHRVTLELCEGGPKSSFGKGGEVVTYCQKPVVSATHQVMAELPKARVAVTLDGPRKAWNIREVDVQAEVKNLDPANPLPKLYYYWLMPGKTGSDPGPERIRFGKGAEGQTTVTVQVRQLVLGKMTTLAEASHTIEFASAAVSIVGPASVRVGSKGAVSAVVRFPEIPTADELRFRWTEETDGLRFSSTGPEQDLNTSRPASYAIRVDVFIVLGGKEVPVGSARHALRVEDAVDVTDARVPNQVPDRVPASPKTSIPDRPKSDGPDKAYYQKLADAFVKSNELGVQRRNTDPSYGGRQFKIEYSHMPTAVYKDGVWYIAAAYTLWQKNPDQTQYYSVFSRSGENGGPDLLSVSDVDKWVTQDGIKWR